MQAEPRRDMEGEAAAEGGAGGGRTGGVEEAARGA